MVTLTSNNNKQHQDQVNSSESSPFGSLLCVSCGKVPLNVVEAKCCNALFCWECGTECSVCPACNKRIGLEDLHENVPIQKFIDKIEISCSYEGCTLRFPAGQRQEHDMVCSYKPMICTNNMECGIILQKDLKNHLEKECIHRLIQCPFNCGTVLPLSKMREHGSQDCPCVLLDCPNNCGVQIARKDVEYHLKEECVLSAMACEYEEFGCQCAPLRMDYAEHIQNNVHEHMKLLKEKIRQQDTVIQQLSQGVSNNNNNNEVPILDFSAAIERGQAIATNFMDRYSDSFLQFLNTFSVCTYRQLCATNVTTLLLMIVFVLCVQLMQSWVTNLLLLGLALVAPRTNFGKLINVVILFLMPRCYLCNVIFGLFLVHRVAIRRRCLRTV